MNRTEWLNDQPAKVCQCVSINDRDQLRSDLKKLGKLGIGQIIPPLKRVEIHDTVQPGLVLRCEPGGKRIYALCYWFKGKGHRDKLDDAKQVAPVTAREHARQEVNRIRGGEPKSLETHQQDSQTVGDVLELHYRTPNRRRQGDLKATTLEGYRQDADRYLSDWLERSAASISETGVEALWQRLKSMPTARARVFRLVQAAFATAVRKRWLASNVVADTRAREELSFQTQRVNRGIRLERLRPWLEAVHELPNNAKSAQAQMITALFTGLRTGSSSTARGRLELAALRWKDLDLTTKALTLPTTKTGAAVTVPISDWLAKWLTAYREEIKGDYVFPGLNLRYWMDRVTTASGVFATPHSLRGTFIAAGRAAGLDLVTCKQLVGHRLADVTVGYAPDPLILRPHTNRVTEKLLELTT